MKSQQLLSFSTVKKQKQNSHNSVTLRIGINRRIRDPPCFVNSGDFSKRRPKDDWERDQVS